MGLALSPGLKSLGGGSTQRPCGKCEAVLGDFITSPGGVPGVKSGEKALGVPPPLMCLPCGSPSLGHHSPPTCKMPGVLVR